MLIQTFNRPIHSANKPSCSVIEQPFKVPHIAAVVQYANDINSETGKEVLRRAIAQAQQLLEEGTWREFKLLIRFFACMQGMYEDDGVFTVLEDLFNCAVDLQTASQEDVSRCLPLSL